MVLFYLCLNMHNQNNSIDMIPRNFFTVNFLLP